MGAIKGNKRDLEATFFEHFLEPESALKGEQGILGAMALKHRQPGPFFNPGSPMLLIEQGSGQDAKSSWGFFQAKADIGGQHGALTEATQYGVAWRDARGLPQGVQCSQNHSSSVG